MHQAVHLTDPDKSTTPGDGYRTDHQKITVRTGGCCPDVGRNELRPYPDRARTVAATRRPAASSAKLLSHLGRPVGEDVLRPGPLDPGQRLRIARSRSIQPFSAAASIIEYSPEI